MTAEFTLVFFMPFFSETEIAIILPFSDILPAFASAFLNQFYIGYGYSLVYRFTDIIYSQGRHTNRNQGLHFNPCLCTGAHARCNFYLSPPQKKIYIQIFNRDRMAQRYK